MRSQLINPLIRFVQAQLKGLFASLEVIEMLRKRAREVAGQLLIDVLAIVVTFEHVLKRSAM